MLEKSGYPPPAHASSGVFLIRPCRLYVKLASPITFNVVNGICLAWAITATEMTLAWNNVSGVYDIRSTGQIIPFVIGTVSLCRSWVALTVKQSAIRHTDILMVRRLPGLSISEPKFHEK